MSIRQHQFANLITILQTHEPRVIGCNIFKNQNSNLDRTQLSSVLKESPNLIGVEVTLNQSETFNVKPPPELPPEQVGFADVIVDADGKLRRSILASKTHNGELKYSLAFILSFAFISEYFTM